MQNISFKPPSKNIKKDNKLVNIIPFNLHYDGEANVDAYFNNKIKTLNSKGIENNFL